MAFLLIHEGGLPRSGAQRTGAKAPARSRGALGLVGRVQWLRLVALTANLVLWGAIAVGVRALTSLFH